MTMHRNAANVNSLLTIDAYIFHRLFTQTLIRFNSSQYFRVYFIQKYLLHTKWVYAINDLICFYKNNQQTKTFKNK